MALRPLLLVGRLIRANAFKERGVDELARCRLDIGSREVDPKTDCSGPGEHWLRE
jgi:hypothetical protein